LKLLTGLENILKDDRIVALRVFESKPSKYKFRAAEHKVENGYSSGYFPHGYPTANEALAQIVEAGCLRRKTPKNVSQLSPRAAKKIEKILSIHPAIVFFFHPQTKQFVVLAPDAWMLVGKTLWRAIKDVF
jgi:hypothetical protein